MTSRDPGPIEKLIRSYVSLCNRRYGLVLGFYLLVTAVAVLFALRLEINPDLRILLPRSTPSVVALETSEERKGSTDLYTIAVQAPTIEAVGKFQKRIADTLGRWEDALWVQYDQDRSFFEKNALLYMPDSELVDLRDRLQGMVDKEFAAANPLLLDLGADEEDKGLEGWPDAEAIRKQGLPQDVVDLLIERVQSQVGKDSVVQAEAVVEPATPTKPREYRDNLIGWNQEDSVWVGVVLVQLKRPSTDAHYAKEMYQRGLALVTHLEPATFHPDLRATVVGAYRNFDEIDQVSSDMSLSFGISILLVLGLLAFYLRRVSSVLMLMIPLLVSMAWTMGVAEVLYGRFTILTAFVLSLLAGLGIDYSIHLYSRWLEERRNGLSIEEAMAAALVITGRSLLSSAGTTIVCLLALQFVHFTGFREFGIVVSVGIACSVVTAWLIVPPLVFAMFSVGHSVEQRFGSRFTWLLPSHQTLSGGTFVPEFRLSRKVMWGMLATGLVVTVILALGPKPSFENDFANLRSKGSKKKATPTKVQKANTVQNYGRAVGAGRNTTPSIIMGESIDQMRQVHDSLSARYGNPADSMLKSFVTIQSFLPSEKQQQARLAILQEIRTLLDSRALQGMEGDKREQLDLLKQYVDAKPFGLEQLPAWSIRFLTERDGSVGKLGYLYGSLRESDALESAKFQDRFQFLPVQGGEKVMVASSGFIYADVVRMVKSDAIQLAFITLLLLGVVVFFDMRSWRGLVVMFTFVLLTSAWTFFIMGWSGLRLGMFNMVLIPTLLSVTVDAAIHIYHRRTELGPGRIGYLFHTTGSSVVVGALTNLFGFIGLCFVNHRGLQTIGNLAVIGMGTSIVILLFVMPIVFELVCPSQPHGDAAGGAAKPSVPVTESSVR